MPIHEASKLFSPVISLFCISDQVLVVVLITNPLILPEQLLYSSQQEKTLLPSDGIAVLDPKKSKEGSPFKS